MSPPPNTGPATSPLASTPDDALLALLAQSLRRGHKRVAAQRFLKLKAIGAEVPGDAKQACEALIATMRKTERERMEEAASRWAEMLAPCLKPS